MTIGRGPSRAEVAGGRGSRSHTSQVPHCRSRHCRVQQSVTESHITEQGMAGPSSVQGSNAWGHYERGCSRFFFTSRVRQVTNNIELRLKATARGTLVKVEVSWSYNCTLHKPCIHGRKSRQRGHARTQVWYLHHCSCSRLTLSCLVISSTCQS